MSSGGSPPHVSCVLIFLDGERFIDEAIRSVVEQAGFDDWELILVDDGSSDASSRIARGWAASDPRRIRYVEHDGHRNQGMSASRNLGVTLAHGTFVAFLDCDDVWLPSALAHRVRVAAAFPTADIVIGGTWRWYSWSGDPMRDTADHRVALPAAAVHTLLRPPSLFAAIYGIPGGGRVPTMCSLLVRRDAILALGGHEAQFRDLYEDQVLYVKAGLHLSAVIDPRPLALYRQHPGSACEVSITDGTWNRAGPSQRAARFFEWMQVYVDGEMGASSEESRIVERNRARNLAPVAYRRNLRDVVHNAAPAPLRGALHHARQRWGRGDDLHAASVLATWSAQHLGVVTASMAGDVLVVLPADRAGEPWVVDVPRSAFGPDVNLVERRLDDLDDLDSTARFDHAVVPFAAAAATSSLAALLAAVEPHLRRTGTLVVLLPGPAHPSAPVVAGAAGWDVAAVSAQAGGSFGDAHVSVEHFGNPITARAVAGVALDHHDAGTVVLVALTASWSGARRDLGSGDGASLLPEQPTRCAGDLPTMTQIRQLARRHLPAFVARAVARVRGRPYVPRPGAVRFGDLRRTSPIAWDFGYGRGGPVDRYYIESFLGQHHDDVRGRVLEIGDASYTHRFGGTQVARADVLHVDPGAPGVTFVGDLANGSFLPDDAFDCIVLTQTLHLVYDFAAALRTIARILVPGGVLLMTVPGISNVDPGEWGSTWHYSFTRHSVSRMCSDCLPGFDTEVTSYGNVLAAVAFLHGLGRDELTTRELDDARPEYGLIHAARVVKPIAPGN
jgi:SAM-dependent methyltransferase